MFEDYKKILLDFYWIKHKSHRLSINLEGPGREKIRNECVEVFLRKNIQQDRDFIRSVFDPTNQSADLVRSIEKFDLNKLRPLVSFLTIKDRNIRDEKLVKLLAWLIDFPEYSEWRKLSEEELKFIFEEAAKKPEEKEEEIEGKEDREKVNDDDELKGKEDTDNDQPEDNKNAEKDNHGPIPRFSIRHIMVTSIILLFIGSTSFIAWENSAATVRMPKSGEECMYWDGDHYEPVKCGAQIAGANIFPLNLKVLKQQRKINLPDTLTSYSLGKVWYKGFVKDHEFFTDSGAYPLDTQRVLKPLSNLILTKYTSNYRHLFTRLVWFICAAFFIGLCGFGVSKLKKEVKQTEEETKADEEETIESYSNEPQATSA